MRNTIHSIGRNYPVLFGELVPVLFAITFLRLGRREPMVYLALVMGLGGYTTIDMLLSALR